MTEWDKLWRERKHHYYHLNTNTMDFIACVKDEGDKMKTKLEAASKLEDVIAEDEYVLTWYYCQLKVDDELKDYQCDYNEEDPNCTTCPLQIKTNEEIQRNYEEIMEKNRHLATSQRLARTEAEQ